jgi:predicted transposase/invertase (TIGR01784 family)
MGRYINLFTDFGFKKIFGSEENKDILLDFLNTLLADKRTIIDLQYLNTERLGNNILERKAVFDLYCENDKGEKFIVELQRAKQEFFKERSIFYASRAIEEQSEMGKWDYNWQAVYTIAIMDFEFSGMGHTNVKSDVILYDLENQMKFTDKLRFIYLEMPKFNKTEAELESNYDKWLYLLKNISDLDEVPAKLQKVLFEKVFNIAEVSNYTPKDRKQYEESLKEYRDYYNTIATAEKEAREEGWQEGREEGREEEKVGVAEKAIIEGFDDQVIQKLTGLSIEQIDELRRKLGK